MPAFLVALIALGALCMVIVFGGLVLGAVLLAGLGGVLAALHALAKRPAPVLREA